MAPLANLFSIGGNLHISLEKKSDFLNFAPFIDNHFINRRNRPTWVVIQSHVLFLPHLLSEEKYICNLTVKGSNLIDIFYFSVKFHFSLKYCLHSWMEHRQMFGDRIFPFWTLSSCLISSVFSMNFSAPKLDLTEKLLCLIKIPFPENFFKSVCKNILVKIRPIIFSWPTWWQGNSHRNYVWVWKIIRTRLVITRDFG